MDENLEKIISYLENKRKANDRFCEQNDQEPTQYMLGSNNTIEETLDYIKTLK